MADPLEPEQPAVPAPAAIILDADQAAQVHGPSEETNLSALNPLPLSDGRFYLGVAVLDDPDHAEWHDLLAACPQLTLDELSPLIPPPPDDE
jgi:hypothetical protein